MRNRKINRMNKEKIAMIASSLLIVTACTLTGVYINGKEKARERENVVDFTALEGETETQSARNDNSIAVKTPPIAEKPETGYVIEQDLDVDPVYQETGSSSIINPGISQNSVNSEDNEEEEKATPQKAETQETDDDKTPDNKEEKQQNPIAETMGNATSLFSETEKLSWPVKGDVLMNYSMDQTIYFATLNQYKYNPALVIKSEPETEVKAPYQGTVKEIGNRAEIGNYVVLDLGNGYELTVGQLENLTVKKGDQVKKEQTIGKTALPSKYYSVEGSNIYLELTKDGKSKNPMDFLHS